jgi:hypothetical protein
MWKGKVMGEMRTLCFGGEKERNFVRRAPGFALRTPDKRIVENVRIAT